jgi:hypothetical protein
MRKARVHLGFRGTRIFRARIRRRAHSCAAIVRDADRAQCVSDEIGGRVHVLLSGVSVFFVVLV